MAALSVASSPNISIIMLAAHTSQAALLNWIAPSGTAASTSGSPTFVTDRGFTGDGVVGYIDLGFACNATPNVSLNSCHVGIWNLTAGNSGRALGQVAAAGTFLTPNAGATERQARVFRQPRSVPMTISRRVIW